MFFTLQLNAQRVNKTKEIGYNKETLRIKTSTSKPIYTIKLEGKGNYVTTGNSRIGGVPDLPDNLKYSTN